MPAPAWAISRCQNCSRSTTSSLRIRISTIVAMLPFLIDTVGGMRKLPITVHATAETLKIIREHIFNWKMWPDFSTIPDETNPFLRFSTVTPGETVDLDGRKITPLPANHVVPAVGYLLDSGAASLRVHRRYRPCDELWAEVNKIENLRYLIIETAFRNGEKKLAIASKHLWPEHAGGRTRQADSARRASSSPT